MIRISLPYIYHLAQNMEPLAEIKEDVKLIDTFSALFNAQSELEVFLNQSVFAPALRSCRDHGNSLMQRVKAITSNIEDPSRILG